MATNNAGNSMISIIVEESILMGDARNSSVAQAKKSFFGLGNVMPSLFGNDFEMIADSRESIAPSSKTNQGTDQASLSDRLTQSLISAGLVKGIIPMSMRDASGQQILDAVLKPPGGGPVDSLREDL